MTRKAPTRHTYDKAEESKRMMMVQMIKQLTGAQAVAIVWADSQMPCQDSVNFGMCSHLHKVEIAVEGFRNDALFLTVADLTGQHVVPMRQHDEEDSD